MDCPEHEIKMKRLWSNSDEVCYYCSRGHMFHLKIDDIEDIEERRLTRIFASDPLVRTVMDAVMECPRGTDELKDVIKEEIRRQRNQKRGYIR